MPSAHRFCMIGRPHWVKPLGQACGRGGSSTIEHAAARTGEILESRARVDRLRDQLGVVAETKLVDGLRATLA